MAPLINKQYGRHNFTLQTLNARFYNISIYSVAKSKQKAVNKVFLEKLVLPHLFRALLSNTFRSKPRLNGSEWIVYKWYCKDFKCEFYYNYYQRFIKMAGNFWQSSHYQQWILDKQDLLRERHSDLQVLTEEEYQKIFIFFANFIQILGEQLKLRQQVIATATVYFKRFYARNSLKCIDPLLLAPTCIFLASKVEEFGVISNSRLISTCQGVVKNKFSYAYSQEFPYRTNHILECEFYLLENLDCCLILYQPYRPLLTLISDIGHDEQQLMTLAWRVVNDSLRTDVCLLFPPYQIALGCLQIACVILGREMKTWFAELNVDLEKIQEVSKYLIQLFDLWKAFDEKKEIPALLAKMPKPKSQSTR